MISLPYFISVWYPYFHFLKNRPLRVIKGKNPEVAALDLPKGRKAKQLLQRERRIVRSGKGQQQPSVHGGRSKLPAALESPAENARFVPEVLPGLPAAIAALPAPASGVLPAEYGLWARSCSGKSGGVGAAGHPPAPGCRFAVPRSLPRPTHTTAPPARHSSYPAPYPMPPLPPSAPLRSPLPPEPDTCP